MGDFKKSNNMIIGTIEIFVTAVNKYHATDHAGQNNQQKFKALEDALDVAAKGNTRLDESQRSQALADIKKSLKDKEKTIEKIEAKPIKERVAKAPEKLAKIHKDFDFGMDLATIYKGDFSNLDFSDENSMKAMEAKIQKQLGDAKKGGKSGGEEPGDWTETAKKNQGGIGGAILGFLAGLATGNPLMAILGLILGFLGGSLMVDGEHGLMGGLMPQSQSNTNAKNNDGEEPNKSHERVRAKTQEEAKGSEKADDKKTAPKEEKISVVKKEDIQSLANSPINPEGVRFGVPASQTHLEFSENILDKNKEVVLLINKEGKITDVEFMSADGKHSDRVPLKTPIQLEKDKDGNYVLPSGDNAEISAAAKKGKDSITTASLNDNVKSQVTAAIDSGLRGQTAAYVPNGEAVVAMVGGGGKTITGNMKVPESQTAFG